MGTLAGHALPGSFFIIFSLWWSCLTCLRFIKSTQKRGNKDYKFKSTITMPCICCPCGLKNLPIESFFKLFFTTVGLIGEIVTGIKIRDKPILFLSTPSSQIADQDNTHEDMHMVHKREATVPVSSWYFIAENSQHSTMYIAFGISAIIEILLHYKVRLPPKIDYAAGAMAFIVEGLLFSFHLHGRDNIDVLMHTLLIYSIAGCVIFSILEGFKPNNALFAYGRILFTFVQGTWFYETGFVLYPPWVNTLDPNNHQHIMFLTMSYIWHIFITIIMLLLQLAIFRKIYNSKHRIYEAIDNFDDEEEINLIYDINSPKMKLIDETKFNNQSDDELDFENFKNIQTNSKIKN